MQPERIINESLNGICPYFTMFPLEFPLEILRTRSEKGERILDPFCGRGTTNYAGRLLGLPSIGIDSSPVAVAITESKMANITPEEIEKTAKEILSGPDPIDIPTGEYWQWAYHESTLAGICKIRESLLADCESDARKALRGVVLGALHGPRKKLGSSYFSNQSQRTYAPKPAYALKYWKEQALEPQQVDVLEVIIMRASRYYCNQGHAEGKILHGDSRNTAIFGAITDCKVDWVITSPPYYGMRTYIPDQWLRMWLLGGKSSVDYSGTSQIKHSGRSDFINELKTVWNNVASICNDNARLVVRFGSINDRKVNPAEIIKSSFEGTGWRCQTIKPAGSAAKGHRQANHINRILVGPQEEYDIWATLHQVH